VICQIDCYPFKLKVARNFIYENTSVRIVVGKMPRIRKISFTAIINLFIKHLYIILLIPLLFVAYPLLVTPGIPIGNGDLPYLETSFYGFKKTLDLERLWHL
jgi:hypothetical protein